MNASVYFDLIFFEGLKAELDVKFTLKGQCANGQ